jgi:mono/diheme cytochrome c family protein
MADGDTDTFESQKTKTSLLIVNKNSTIMKLSDMLLATFIAGGALLFSSCKEGVKKDQPQVDISKLADEKKETHGTEMKESDVTLSNPLNTDWVSAGKGIYELKCQSCHRLTGEKLVGPGWKGVTKNRKPVWIMNMITNVDMMLETDPEAQKLLELCMVRMPNQNISQDDARKILEYMRSNDGEK